MILHRYVGLAIATFLIIAGLTGAIIAWHDKLDDLLNPNLRPTSKAATQLQAAELARAVEERDPRVRVTYLPIPVVGRSPYSVFVEPRVDPQTDQVYVVEYNQVFLDPATSLELGRREWGQTWPIKRQTLIPFLYKLHYSLHLPSIWGKTSVGVWLMGAVAGVWCLDCFVGFYLTLPRRHRTAQATRSGATKTWRARWAPAWHIKLGASSFRMFFDIHRAVGLWTWILLLSSAFTGFSLALDREVLRPVLAAIAKMSPSPFDTEPLTRSQIEPSFTFAEIIEKAKDEARKRGTLDPLGAIAYDAQRAIYSAYFSKPGDDTGPGGAEPFTLFFDGRSGRRLGERTPWHGTAADIFLQSQFPVHSGRILGFFGRLLVSMIGLAVATLSVSGVVIWWRKRAARWARRRAEIAALASA